MADHESCRWFRLQEVKHQHACDAMVAPGEQTDYNHSKVLAVHIWLSHFFGIWWYLGISSESGCYPKHPENKQLILQLIVHHLWLLWRGVPDFLTPAGGRGHKGATDNMGTLISDQGKPSAHWEVNPGHIDHNQERNDDDISQWNHYLAGIVDMRFWYSVQMVPFI